ncbi:MAG TPA: serine hydrolase domain-containing protein, partial [Thermoanaerobaculia bacterium]
MRTARRLLRSLVLPLVFVAASCATLLPATGKLDTAALREIDATIERAIADGKTIGGVLFVESDGQRYGRTYGLLAVEPERIPAIPDAIYDMASLTKVVATTPSVMILVERGKIDLDAPVKTYIPETADPDITIRHLLTHTSALKSGLSLKEPWQGYDEGIRRAAAEIPTNRPGHVFRYSDINFILLGEVVRRVSGLPLNEFAKREIYDPLGMKDTVFLPPKARLSRIAPTERAEGEGILRGVVHDPTSRRMGGVAGHAGLFSTIDDLRRYVGMILGGGELDGVRVMKPETVRLMTSDGTPKNVGPRRSLGWDMETMYSRLRGDFPFGSFGHTGFTGPTIWIDPASRSFYIFLTNRVHPDGKGNINEL